MWIGVRFGDQERVFASYGFHINATRYSRTVAFGSRRLFQLILRRIAGLTTCCLMNPAFKTTLFFRGFLAIGLGNVLGQELIGKDREESRDALASVKHGQSQHIFADERLEIF